MKDVTIFEERVNVFAEAVRERRSKAGLPVDAACLAVTDGNRTTAYHKLYNGTFPAHVFESYAPPGHDLIVEKPEELARAGEIARAHGVTFND